MKYSAIGFDYMGVIDGVPGTVFRQKFCELVGISDNQYQNTYFAHNKKVNKGEITWEELWKLVLGDLGKPEKLRDVLELQAEFMKEKINQEVLALVDELRTKGYKTGLLSNNTVEAAGHLRDIGIASHFDVFHVSAETKLVKPEPAAFAHLAEALGVAKDRLAELIFIDDTETSLSTSAESGFTPILFENCEQLRSKLTKMGVL